MITVKINDVETPVESLPSDMISTGEQFSEEERTNIAAALAKTLSNPLYRAVVGIEERERLDAMVGGAFDEAEQLLLERRKLRDGGVVPFECDGVPLGIRKVSHTRSIEIALMIHRSGSNEMDIRDYEGAKAASIALISQLVCKPNGDDFLTAERVEQFMDEPGEAEFISLLLGKCMEVNPNIIKVVPKKKQRSLS